VSRGGANRGGGACLLAIVGGVERACNAVTLCSLALAWLHCPHFLDPPFVLQDDPVQLVRCKERAGARGQSSSEGEPRYLWVATGKSAKVICIKRHEVEDNCRETLGSCGCWVADPAGEHGAQTTRRVG